MKHRGCFGAAKPLSIAAIDAAIEATIGKPPRRDRLARDDGVYRWLVRRCMCEGSFRIRTTYAEAARGSGYDVPHLGPRAGRRRARQQRVSTIYRALCSLRAAGLIEFEGVKRKNGQWRCLGIRLLPAGVGRPPAGESCRRPRRNRATGRVSFSRRSGTSPAVVPGQTTSETSCGLTRARARAPGAAGSESERARKVISEALANPGDRYERWRDADPELVELCELFEQAFGRPAKFSFRRHGSVLRRVLARIDRYWHGGTPGAGVEEARILVQSVAEDLRWRLGSESTPHSLAYFLPILDEISKDRRRWWKQRHGAAKREQRKDQQWNAKQWSAKT